FDFTHSQALTQKELSSIEDGINQLIQDNFELKFSQKKLAEAMEEGATALFGEKYGDEVRTIQIGQTGREKPFSYELCGGTHVHETSEIGTFIITSEGSAAAGIRRIEAVTGRKAYEYIQMQKKILKNVAKLLDSNIENLDETIKKIQLEKKDLFQTIEKVAEINTLSTFRNTIVHEYEIINFSQPIKILPINFESSTGESIIKIIDLFKIEEPNGIAAMGTISPTDNTTTGFVYVSENINKNFGISANEIAKKIGSDINGGGGGSPILAKFSAKGPRDLSKVLNNEYIDKIIDIKTKNKNIDEKKKDRN
ncbi:MAG: hypothetical protein KJ818_00825, partial [Candidatus Omnitrophica bacterium]|nr:hypothetical protein [Candidatus Omnitrophota bacterium]